MFCESCRVDIPTGSIFCNRCGSKQTRAIKDSYLSPYGTWEVSTEGDCEGRSTKRLGTHQGYVDEIASSLAGQECYSLNFRRVYPKSLSKTAAMQRESVSVQFDIDSGNWDLNPEAIEIKARGIFKGRPGVTVSRGTGCGSFILNFKK